MFMPFHCIYQMISVISSSEPKAQVSFSDQNMSIVCCCPWHCHKLFTFPSSSPEPMGQFQPNLAQSILGWRGFKFVYMKGSALFQGEIITKKCKYIDEIKKSSSPEPLGQFQPNLAQCILRWWGLKLFKWKAPPFSRGDWKYIDKLKNIILQNRWANFNQLGTMHPWLKGIQVCSNEELLNFHKVNYFFLFS